MTANVKANNELHRRKHFRVPEWDYWPFFLCLPKESDSFSCTIQRWLIVIIHILLNTGKPTQIKPKNRRKQRTEHKQLTNLQMRGRENISGFRYCVCFPEKFKLGHFNPFTQCLDTLTQWSRGGFCSKTSLRELRCSSEKGVFNIYSAGFT